MRALLLRLSLSCAVLLSAACSTNPRHAPDGTYPRPAPVIKPARKSTPPDASSAAGTRRPPKLRPGAAPSWEKDAPPEDHEIPSDIALTPDPEPVFETPSAGGNAPSYKVFGRRYHVLSTASGYRKRGLASWYGKKFHGRQTSNGETYDMFALTAAHKTLPLPTYARVTNNNNGKQVIVRINDRGPFHEGRIIDLSYAAAARLGTVGTIADVTVEALTPDNWPSSAESVSRAPAIEAPLAVPTEASGRYRNVLQIAAFADPINAVSARETLYQQGFKTANVVISELANGNVIHRVVIGPFAGRQRLDEARIRARQAGYAPVALIN